MSVFLNAATAAMLAAESFAQRPTRGQTPGPISLFLTADTVYVRKYRHEMKLTTAMLRTHGPDDYVIARIALRSQGLFKRKPAVVAAHALCSAAAQADGHALAYAQPGLAIVVPRCELVQTQVVGDPSRLRRYATNKYEYNPELLETRKALMQALASDWPTNHSLWEAPLVHGLTAHQRLEVYSSLPSSVATALSQYTQVRTGILQPTFVRTGGLLLFFLPRKARLPGYRLVDILKI